MHGEAGLGGELQATVDAPVVPGWPLLAGPLHVDHLLLLGGHLEAPVDAVPEGLLNRQEVLKTGREAREDREEREKMEEKRIGRRRKKEREEEQEDGQGERGEGRRMRRVRRGLRMMGISNVDETNLPELLHLHTGGTSAQAQVVAGGTVHVCEGMRG